jgi:DNA ligase-4
MQTFTIPHPKEEHWVRWCNIAANLIRPQVGVQIGRGEFVKAHSCAHAVKLSGKRKMIMERKYDGEYCQVHIDLSKGLSKCFRIYSKSGRDSTRDRIGIHDTLRRALKLDDPEQRQFKEKCIVVGELLVYNSREQMIKPFDYLRRHIMRAGRFIGNANDPPPSPNSHLMIVLFDVLLVDDKSYLHLPLSQRRMALEELIVSKKTGWCEVSRCTEIDFSQPSAVQRLFECFGAGIKMCWEGFVLKPLDSPYLDLTRNHPDKTTKGYGFVGAWNSWIKLKKDYIQGLGDTADFAVVGGAVAPGKSFLGGQVEGGLSTFHVAVLVNKEQVKTFGTKPRLKVLFEVSYSISKLDLEWIQRIAYLEAVEYEVSNINPNVPGESALIDL